MKHTDLAACVALLGAAALLVSVAGGFIAWAVGAVALLFFATTLYWVKRTKPSTSEYPTIA